MAIVRYSATAVGLTLLLYLSLVIIAVPIFDRMGVTKTLDVGSAASDLVFGTSGLSAVVYNRLPLRRGGNRIIMIGASNMGEIPAGDITTSNRDTEVDNMSISGSVPQDWSRILDLAYEMIPLPARRQTTFVAGVWYGSFMFDRPQEADELDNELLRFGLYRRLADGNVALRVPIRTLPIALTALRPLILEIRFWDSLALQNRYAAESLLAWTKNSGSPDEFARDDVVTAGPSHQEFLLAKRVANARPLNPGAFDALKAEAVKVSQSGGRFVIADLPLPSWHSNNVPEFAEYQQQKWRYFVGMLKLPGVFYVNLQTGVSDSDFYDSVHPKPIAARAWARRLGSSLTSLPPE